MKQILIASVAALALVAATLQQASAWSKYNFGVGLNVGWEGGGNSYLFGLLKGAQSPGQGDGYFPGGAGGPGFDSAPIMPGSVAPKPLPGGPEKVGPPTPVKQANYEYQPTYYPTAYQPLGYYYPYYYTAYPGCWPR